ncbi:hypothetical protein [Corynebacterium crudilactis]|uniref:Uncharacterized protein n=1 Tax=Corynebacterium crudilactis TaxID=1652495 RepID=A0A172QVB5_9CORY|nr:hypothetical protein [Corynebacterium crudilactis]ANE04645.1 hypothetical protein ccrud_10800 [Corynebacterium crudilactis]
MKLKHPVPQKPLKLRSRDNQIVHVSDPRDRAFLEQADELIIKIDELLEDRKSKKRTKFFK